MKMTENEWRIVEKRLDVLLGGVKLNCDGYRLSLRLSRITNNKLAITVFVNRKLRGKWLLDDCEERSRFMRPFKRFVWSKKARDMMQKIGKATLKEKAWDPKEKRISYSFYWPSFKPLKKHLIANNKEITLISE